jgi:hypothetical protein
MAKTYKAILTDETGCEFQREVTAASVSEVEDILRKEHPECTVDEIVADGCMFEAERDAYYEALNG